MLNPATRKTCLPWMRFIGRSSSRSITWSTLSFVSVSSVTIFGTTSARSSRIESSSQSASSSEFRSGSNAASAVGNEPRMTPQTTPRSVRTLTSPARSSSSIVSNDPSMIAATWIAGSPHFAATDSTNVSCGTVSLAM